MASGSAAEDDPSVVRERGSNAWALGPSKTTSGRATLFANPHVDLFGPGARYECVLKSGEGLEFDGFCILGSPLPHAGHNPHLGWSHTNTHADGADAYRLTLVGTDAYRVGDRTLKLERETTTIPVRVGDRLVDRTVTIERSIYGPVYRQGGAAYAVRLPVERNLDYWPQKLAMAKARDLGEFRRALAYGALTYSNTTYADDAGHVAFWYGSTVPRRDARFRLVEARGRERPADGLEGVLSPEDLPHVIDPEGGFVQNCNSDPWHTTVGRDNPRPEDYPPYIVRDPDTTRAQNSRRILASQARFSWDEARAASPSTRRSTRRRSGCPSS